jgi:hypothetical protein
LGSPGKAATNRPIVPAPGDYDDGENLVELLAGETEVLGENLYPPQTPHAARTRTRVAPVGSQ